MAHKKWTNAERKYLRENASKFSIAELSTHLERSPNALYKQLSITGIGHQSYNKRYMAKKSRRYKVNHDFFSVIDTEEKAYFLGFLYADGYNYHAVGRVSIGIHEKDVEILKMWLSCMESNYPIYRRIDSRPGRNSIINTVEITSRKLSDDLAAIGCTQSKTKTITMPCLPVNLIRHFIRGYFDGDGSVVVSHKMFQGYDCSVVRASITSNINFLKELMRVISAQMGSTKSMSVVPDKRHDQIGSFSISGIKKVTDFLSWIYDDCVISMSRKRKKYELLKKGVRNNKRGSELSNLTKVS